MRLKSAPGKVIGAIALFRREQNNRGFWLTPAQHNCGLMTEATCAVNDFWFDVLGFTVLRALKAVGNDASRRISQKTGMRLLGVECGHAFVAGTLEAEIWEITAAEWRAYKSQGPA